MTSKMRRIMSLNNQGLGCLQTAIVCQSKQVTGKVQLIDQPWITHYSNSSRENGHAKLMRKLNHCHRDTHILCLSAHTLVNQPDYLKIFRNYSINFNKHFSSAHVENQGNKPSQLHHIRSTDNVPNHEDLVEASDKDIRSLVLTDMLVYENFIDEQEEKSLFQEVENYLKRLRYEFNHWDNAIHGFRETERRTWNETNQKVLERVRSIAFPPGSPQMSLVHVLDLAKDGYIKPHIDSIRFCGGVIAGLSLLSPSVMRLKEEKNPSNFADVFLKPRSLYVMKGKVRYDYTHEILKSEESVFKGNVVPRERRISVVCRVEPEECDKG